MADALVSFLIEKLGTVTVDEMKQEVRLVIGVRNEVKKLTNTLQAVQAVLNDAEHKQIKDQSVKFWLQQLKNVAYDIDDVLDEWRTQILETTLEDKNNGTSNKQFKKKVSSYLCFCPFSSCYNKLGLRYEIAFRIKHLRESLDFIANEKSKYQFVSSEGRSVVVVVVEQRQKKTSSVIVDMDILGRDYDKQIILNKLLSTVESSTTSRQEYETSSTDDPRVITVIRMGGLGKTTLAQLVYNDKQVKTHFEMTMWVCVSDTFDLTRIAKEIIQQANETPPADALEWNNVLHEKLCKSVKGKQFLLVLDDVWTENPNNLNPLKHLLNEGADGSRILITTRHESVAQMMCSKKYELGVLSFDDCLSVLRCKAFDGRKKEESDVLQEISFEIAKKCGGLPLAANLLGSLLRKKRSEKDWRRVLESTIWELQGFDQEKLFNPALLLSYEDLPSRLKRCFEYCAIFPKDHELTKQMMLIEMWMAQGLLNSTETGDLQLELIGEDYFNELAALSFFKISIGMMMEA